MASTSRDSTRPSHGTPMGEAVSLGVHESQSRLWENLVGRGRAFWAYWLPDGPPDLPRGAGRRIARPFHAAVNHVSPSLDPGPGRRGDLQPAHHRPVRAGAGPARRRPGGRRPPGGLEPEVPGVPWASHPANDAEGCLQDIHWSAGLIGYFPTYTLGNVYAAQLFAAAQAELGGLDDAFARGDFGGLLGWLREKVHRQGQRYRAADLIERVTGSRPDHRPLIDGLRRKYAELYGI